MPAVAVFRRHRAPAWRRVLYGAGVGLLLLAGLATSVQAQWLTQHVSLQPGWNAVPLEVQPEPGECAQVFAGQPIESVWKWNASGFDLNHIPVARE